MNIINPLVPKFKLPAECGREVDTSVGRKAEGKSTAFTL